ncbi:MAG: type II toxin-antitoxin system VapB family antitoxin [Propionicimonas sp.]
MSKTLIDIDDAVLERARELSGISTKKGVVAAALDEMVRRLERERYTEFVLRGELDDLADPDVVRSAQR